MSKQIGGRAVVIGAGIGGLAAGGALAPYFRQVVILERDRLPDVAEARAGTAQGRHTHGLLAGGLKALNEIFPGYRQALVEAGAIPIHVAQDVRYERADVGALPQRDLGISFLCASRPLIELVLRRQLQSLANVEIWPECKVTEILSAKPARAVHGVRFDMKSGEAELLHADLIVDASGRPTLTMALLEALGIAAPAVTEIGIDINLHHRRDRYPRAGSACLENGADPTRSAEPGALRRADTGRVRPLDGDDLPAWRRRTSRQLGQISAGLSRPDHADDLRGGAGHEARRRASGITDFPPAPGGISKKSAHLPRGLLPIADSLCRFNPIHGQGMSSAALQARLLRHVLERASMATDPIPACCRTISSARSAPCSKRPGA